MHIQKIDNNTFSAIPVANVKVKGLQNKYKLYDITHKDREFLEDFYDSIDLKKLMPGLKEGEYLTWDGIIQSAIELSARGGRKTILEVCDNKPCGLLNYSQRGDHFHLNYIATIPIEPTKKVPFAGQVLFNEFFRRVLDSCVDKIELKAVKNAPFSPKSKYLKLGFVSTGGNDFAETMKIYRNGIVAACEKQDEFICYEPELRQQNVNLGISKKTGSLMNRLLSSFLKIF